MCTRECHGRLNRNTSQWVTVRIHNCSGNHRASLQEKNRLTTGLPGLYHDRRLALSLIIPEVPLAKNGDPVSPWFYLANLEPPCRICCSRKFLVSFSSARIQPYGYLPNGLITGSSNTWPCTVPKPVCGLLACPANATDANIAQTSSAKNRKAASPRTSAPRNLAMPSYTTNCNVPSLRQVSTNFYPCQARMVKRQLSRQGKMAFNDSNSSQTRKTDQVKSGENQLSGNPTYQELA